MGAKKMAAVSPFLFSWNDVEARSDLERFYLSGFLGMPVHSPYILSQCRTVKTGIRFFLGPADQQARQKTVQRKPLLDLQPGFLYNQALRKQDLRELEKNNIRISCRTFVRHQGVMAGA